ncbi:murein biosynthesis integral membrane protein MurJ [Corynebacterium flavescens]|uniref:Virulence factor n=1 Tax=Corynebacterium flavescens TaxID=28028 RepID=A0AB73B7I3_CORFL|nr:murein biosynthesis integral membrane protein MurJ [Corynebacterium flavescens]KAA8719566.1 murein biosynthesis integral membrane protein MurJ [Corynebacterium flavescens]MDN6099976.1 murein biosynthesis integral membrane protein MurJ [Corynebacterium flavescens]MDN6431239.1 murein biosynthesis integral membrane protein MurJ [Corynebacterium flavescens]MDN6475489.1 murein biosynthesis integral membrane protein MurJ [Corynebacterium flavescens]MDN6531935.1 murein biosynthesis integral membra
MTKDLGHSANPQGIGTESVEASTAATTAPSSSIGARRRIVTASPPAPVPDRRSAPANQTGPVAPVEDKSALRRIRAQASDTDSASASTSAAGEESAQQRSDSDSSVVRATGSMALATMISRITGFLRNVLIGSSLGPAISSAFTTANQLPNLITEIVLGAVLTSLVVPVLVRAEKEDADRGEAFVRRLFTLAFSLLGIITIASCIFAPQLTMMMLPEDGKVNGIQATSFAFLLLPQIFFYGLFALFQAVLNTKNVFGPGAWAPVLNNIISIAVLVAYQLVPGSLHPQAPSPVSDPHVLLLGLGTTLGVVLQCLILFPSLKKAGINLRPLWGLDDRLRQFGGMALAIVAYVAISQLGYVITTRVAATADAGAPFTYQQAWLLLQVPYGVIGVTLLTAIMPRLSRNAADGDVKAVVRDLTLGTKLTFIALIPVVVFMTGFGIPITRGLFQYGQFDSAAAELLGLTLSFSAFTLIPYALVLLHLRVFYAREEAWTPTFIIAGITFTKIVLSLLAPHVADSPQRVVILLGTANGFGFIAGAVIGGFLLKRKLGSLGGRAVMATTAWATFSSLIGLGVTYLLSLALNAVLPADLPGIVVLVRLAVYGLTFVVVTGLVLSRSGLPEVVNLGRQLQRIPGLSRIIKIDEAAAIEVEAPDMQEIQPIFNQDAFNSSPIPPPMSAGIVRGPRLVPGAPVSDGRFRLLHDCGSVPGARFWQAREQESGRLVSLTFVDTTGESPLAPAPPAIAARRSAAVSRSTRRLAELNLDSVADNVDILSYRSGCLVVADWVEGTSLKAVAQAGDLDPHAVAHALSKLVADTTTAHHNHLVFGLDNRDRIRISTDGVAKLAFPAVLERNTPAKDAEAIASAISLLVDATSPTPEVLRSIAEDAAQVKPVPQGQETQATEGAVSTEGTEDTESEAPADTTLREIARRLEAYAHEEEPDGTIVEEKLSIAQEPTHKVSEPEATTGFGGRGYSGSGVFIIAFLATIFVVGMAALTTWIMSLIGNGDSNSPVDSDSLKQETSTARMAPAVLLREDSALSVPEGAQQPALIDNASAPAWSTQEKGSGVLVKLSEPAQLSVIQLSQSSSQGAQFEVYGVHSASFDPANPTPATLPLLAAGEFESTQADFELRESAESFDSVLVLITQLPESGTATLSDVQIIGRPHS